MIFNPKPSLEHSIIDYIDGNLSGKSLTAFKRRLETEPELYNQVDDLIKVKNILSHTSMVQAQKDYRLNAGMVGIKPPRQPITLFFERSFVIFALIFFSLVAVNNLLPSSSPPTDLMSVSMESALAEESMPLALEAPMAAAPVDPIPDVSPEEMAKVAPPMTAPEPEAGAMMAADAVQNEAPMRYAEPTTLLDQLSQHRQTILISVGMISLALVALALTTRFEMEKNWKNKFTSGDDR